MIFHQFTVSNFRSIKEPLTLTMEAADVTGPNQEIDDRNLVLGPDGKYLKVKALYGGNAAGKSNLIKALYSFTRIVFENRSAEFDLTKHIQTFQLSPESNQESTLFEVIFSEDGKIYRYGFKADMKLYIIQNEWLLITERNGREEIAFHSTDGLFNEISEKYFKKGYDFMQFNEVTREDKILYPPNLTSKDLGWLEHDIFENGATLNLFHLYDLEEPFARLVVNYILGGIRIFNLTGLAKLNNTEIEKATSEGPIKTVLLNLLKFADLNIIDISSQDLKGEEGQKVLSILITKIIKDEKGVKVGEQIFNLNQESDGTKKLFMLGRVIEGVLTKAGVIFIDELDARFHPLLTSMIVELFQNPETNPKGAQLIFITHDTQFLSLKRFRPDQIAFVSRNKANATEISTLIEFEGIENDTDVKELYLKGLLDGVPNLNLFLESFKRS